MCHWREGGVVWASCKESTTADLKEGDIVRVTYTESEGKLIARTVTARAARLKR